MTIDERTEWLEPDGRGGFASGTASGVRTRRYHALLLPATTPPTGRVVLVNGVDASLETARGVFALSSQRYGPDVLHPDGASRIISFTTEPWPAWDFDLPGETRVRQELFVDRATGATWIAWTLLAGSAATLRVRPFLSGRLVGWARSDPRFQPAAADGKRRLSHLLRQLRVRHARLSAL